MKKRISRLLKTLQQEICCDSGKERFRTEIRYFTRDRVFTFSCVVLMRLNLMSKSLSVEINKFLSRFSFKKGSKQAYSKAVQHIKWEAFEHYNNFLIKGFYAEPEYHKYKDKYLVLATDGTTYELPYEKALIEHFGEYSNDQMQPICMSQSVKLYDVLNHLTLRTSLSPYNVKGSKGNSEQALFEKQLDQLTSLIDVKQHRILLLGDKYYPSFYYFEDLPKQGFDFVFRCKPSFCKEVQAFVNNEQKEAILKLDMSISQRKYNSSAKRLAKPIPQYIEVRCVRIDIGDEKAAFLLTNIDEQELTRQELGELYGLRWGEEVSFDIDKNLVEIENFSSKSPKGVLQEFYAKILTTNIAELLIDEAQQTLEQIQAKKNNKHSYKINRAVAIGLIKDEIVPFLNGSEDAEEWFARMVKLILPHRSPIREGRTFPKKRKHKLKFSMNKRRVI